MTQDEIIEGNKIISRFMSEEIEPYNEHGEFVSYIGISSDSDYHSYGSMKYHTSWDWLMPVVEKIENTDKGSDEGEKGYSVSIQGCLCDVQSMTVHHISQGFERTKIEAVWNAVVAFIKWYNQQSK